MEKKEDLFWIVKRNLTVLHLEYVIFFFIIFKFIVEFFLIFFFFMLIRKPVKMSSKIV